MLGCLLTFNSAYAAAVLRRHAQPDAHGHGHDVSRDEPDGYGGHGYGPAAGYGAYYDAAHDDATDDETNHAGSTSHAYAARCVRVTRVFSAYSN